MPIFTSRFSPDRSLLGNIRTAPSQTETKEPASQSRTRRSEGVSSRSNREEDRFELSSNPIQDAGNSRQTGSALGPQVQSSSGLTRQQNAEAVSETQPPNVPPPSRSDSTESSRPGNQPEPAFQVIIQENLAAAENAGPSRFEAFLNRIESLRSSREPSASQVETRESGALPVGVDALVERLSSNAEAQGSSPDPPVRPDRNDSEFSQGVFESALEAPQPREAQEESLRQDLQTISRGLQSDAAIESRQNATEAARNTEISSQRGQRQEIQANQAQIRELQSSRRSTARDMQRTDRAIRQLQNRNARIQSNARSSTTNSGGNVDLLAN